MNTTRNARTGLTSAQETLHTPLLIVLTLFSAWLFYRVPWRLSPDPCLLASVAAAVLIICLWLTRWCGLRGANFERTLLAAFLVGMPLVYLLRYLFDSTERTANFWLWVEILGLALFVALAVAGLKRSPWFLAIGIVLHGLGWDAWHYQSSTYMPDWYAIFCMAVDLALGVYVAARVPAYQAAQSIAMQT